MACLHAAFRLLAMSLFILAMLTSMVLSEGVLPNPNDIHGGVTMGVSNVLCDDGKTNIAMDYDPRSSDEYTCTENIHNNYKVGLQYNHCDEIAQRPLHICYPRNISYTEDLPTSGSHRPIWPKYGTYKYVPPQRWIHSLEHGAVVFLYHPCADPSQIEQFKGVARSCMYRHIIAPYKKLPPEMNFALLAWRCKLVLSSVDVPSMVNFVKTHALQAPEHTSRDGLYEAGLLRHAQILSDQNDSELCPKMSIMSVTAEDFKTKSAARRSKSRLAQEELMQILSQLLA
ncbi:hypothetical protein BsWGS_08467 [Bradybaena similaris]